MRHPPIKCTPEIEAILLREAQLRLESRTIKEIAAQIGASRTYVQGKLATLMSQLQRQTRLRNCSTLPCGPLDPEKNS